MPMADYLHLINGIGRPTTVGGTISWAEILDCTESELSTHSSLCFPIVNVR